MSETTEVTADVTSGGTAAEAAVAERAGTTRRRRAGGGLASMLLPELQSLAASLGISGTARMRKSECGINGEGAVEGLERTGIQSECQIAALDVRVPRGGGGG